MKVFWIGLIIALRLSALESEGYVTVGMVSHHFSTDEKATPFNQQHDAYGAEFVFDGRYTLAYLHFINSRDKTTDIAALGYRYPIWEGFGVYAVAGYQRGYCFDGVLSSVECTAGRDNDGFAFLPMLYYRHDRFILDLISQGSMISLKLNLKLF